MLLLLCLAALQDDTYPVTLSYARMHCDECRSETEALLKRLPGFKSMTLGETSAQVLFSEQTPPSAPAGLPRDIGYRGASADLRGTVVPAGEKLTFQVKGSGVSLTLGNPAQVAELRKALGGKNRFKLSGRLEGKTLALDSFQAADW